MRIGFRSVIHRLANRSFPISGRRTRAFLSTPQGPSTSPVSAITDPAPAPRYSGPSLNTQAGVLVSPNTPLVSDIPDRSAPSPASPPCYRIGNPPVNRKNNRHLSPAIPPLGIAHPFAASPSNAPPVANSPERSEPSPQYLLLNPMQPARSKADKTESKCAKKQR